MSRSTERARDAWERQAWGEAYEQFSAAAQAGDLGADDLERYAVVAALTGHDDESAGLWEAAHRGWLARGEPAEAARCAFWLTLGLLLRGQTAQAGGWLARAQRIVEADDLDCVARGYLLIPALLHALADDDPAAAYEMALEAGEIGRRFGDADLMALGLLSQGQAATAQGDTERGVALLDETMVAVTAGEVSPIPAGIVYCAVIDACMNAFDMRRAAEWTEALGRWCARQPDLVAYQGQCLVHRAQIFTLHGEWPEAVSAAEQARDRLTTPLHPALGVACYQKAELHRLRGEFDQAQEAYRAASQHGTEPAPGLALLRLAEGRADAAAAAISRALEETHALLERPPMLAAAVEIRRASGDIGAARAAADELADIAAQTGVLLLAAMADQASGSVLLAEGDPSGALTDLRQASAAWQALEMPYERARTGVLIGLACAALGDRDTAAFEFDTARRVLETLGAAPDLARLDQFQGIASKGAEAVTTREREVLRLVAAGKTNRDIASELVISEHTVARHVQNIFTKFGVSSRAAATAYAYEHDLV